MNISGLLFSRNRPVTVLLSEKIKWSYVYVYCSSGNSLQGVTFTSLDYYVPLSLVSLVCSCVVLFLNSLHLFGRCVVCQCMSEETIIKPCLQACKKGFY